jgi:uncharacterized protein YcfL
MKRNVTIVMLLAASLAAGCAGNKSQKAPEEPKTAFGCPMEHAGGATMDKLIAAKVTTAGEVPDVKVTELRCRMQADLMRIDLTLTNASGDVRRVSYRFDWFDEAGFKAWDDESWKPVMLYEKSSQTLVAGAPTRKAVDFKIVLLDQDKERK